MKHASEHSLQVGVAHYLEVCLDPALTWWTAIDHGVGKLGYATAALRKKRGVKRGIPDVIIIYADAGRFELLGIELKTSTGRLSPEQRDVSEAWAMVGAHVRVARSIEQVQSILIQEHVPLQRTMQFFGGQDHVRQCA